MERLDQYFSYNKDYSNIEDIYLTLYKKLKIIHDNGMYVPVLDSLHILCDDSFSFDKIVKSSNIALDRRENLVALTKLFLGTYLSLSTSFRDFSSVDTEWFAININAINSSLVDDGFEPNYFERVLTGGENIYYNDYLISKNEKQDGTLNSKGYAKVLSNSGSKLYQDPTEVSTEIPAPSGKSAFVNSIFYPVLIICSFLIGFVVFTCFKYLK